MAWIKRNLVFVIGGAVAVLLMVWAGFSLVSNWRKNEGAKKEVEAAYTELKRLYSQNPHPGDNKIDNIRKAREEQERVEDFIKEASSHFEPIPAIPPGKRVSGEQFTSALRRTIDQLQRDAERASVDLPPKYSFTFAAQEMLLKFSSGSLDRLASSLGEIKAICGILYQARVNALEGLRRERISTDDSQGVADYLEESTTTNELAIITPYEVSFRCFSSELAGVLNGFAASPRAYFIKSVNVEPAPDTGFTNTTGYAGMPPGYTPGYTPAPVRNYAPPAATPGYQRPGGTRYNPEAEFEGGSPGNPFTQRYGGRRYGGAPTPAPPVVQRYVQRNVSPAGSRGGLETVIDEGPLRVTMRVHVIKLLETPPEQ